LWNGKGLLRDLLGGGTVTMSGSGHDQYGRELRSVQVGGQDSARR
jgi:endonuclease YncB( thermonuclease family)